MVFCRIPEHSECYAKKRKTRHTHALTKQRTNHWKDENQTIGRFFKHSTSQTEHVFTTEACDQHL
jgi:hypothetical protein